MRLNHSLRLLWVLAGLFAFVLALETTRAGASDAADIIDRLSVSGFGNSLGLGWLFAYVVLSGSPVAAVAVSLFSEGTLTQQETFAMVAGSRLGASFIALAVGAVYFFAGRRSADGLGIGVVALLTTFATQIPALALGTVILNEGWLDGVRVSTPSALLDATDAVYGPIVDVLDAAMPDIGLFLAGVALILGSFWLFDRALPSIEGEAESIQRLLRALRRRPLMFATGFLVTLTTLSVSISVTVLVPLALKGYLRREHVIPYILGANIATFVDTLGASFLVGGDRAVVVVLTQVVSLSVVSVLALTVAYRPLAAAVLAGSGWATSSSRRLAVFMLVIVGVPGLLLVL